MATNLATPGVYIEEKNAFPNSVAGIPTSVPAFVGYTQNTRRDGRSLINKPVRISSLNEFVNIFGEGTKTKYSLVPADSIDDVVLSAGGKDYKLIPEQSSRFLLFDSIRLFFANGGGTCYIVSVGGYEKEASSAAAPAKDDKAGKNSPATAKKDAAEPNQISKKALLGGIQALVMEQEPTMLVIPESVMLDEGDCFSVQQEMLTHCGFKMKSRFALLDVYNGSAQRTYDKSDVINRFREGIGLNHLAYGAAYYPWVHSTVVDKEEVDLSNIANISTLEEVLSKEVDDTVDNAKKADEIKNEIKKISQKDTDIEKATQMLNVVSPGFTKLMAGIRTHLNILPPAAGMAGVYCVVDGDRGIWKAPANVSVNSVTSPVIQMTHDDQEDLNVTVSGKSINAIRAFVGDGTTVWGARTLEGNSQDWKYINVRRTIIFIEQSIKYAAKKYVYEPNTVNTWVLIRGMINSFLNDIWRQGGLVGLTPSEAYDVQVGIGSTMTSNDVLDGIMRITVKVAVSRPAEFIVITFQQKMQES